MWNHQAKAVIWMHLKILIFSPIFSLYTYWTMYSVNFKSFRLKMTSKSRYVVQNTTFEISPFKVSSHIPWYNKCTMKILKKRVEKMPPMLQFFLRWQIKGQWWRKKTRNRFFSRHYLNRPVSQNRKYRYTQVLSENTPASFWVLPERNGYVLYVPLYLAIPKQTYSIVSI